MYRKSTDGAEVDPREEEALQLVQEAERLEVQFIFIMAHTHCTGPGPGPALGQGPGSGTMIFHILYYVLYTLHGDRDREPLFSIVPIPVPVLVLVPVPCSMYEPLCLTCVVSGKECFQSCLSDGLQGMALAPPPPPTTWGCSSPSPRLPPLPTTGDLLQTCSNLFT